MTNSEYPRCPNASCKNHNGSIKPNEAFKIADIEKDNIGRILKQDAVNMVYCSICGQIIGVASK